MIEVATALRQKTITAEINRLFVHLNEALSEAC